MKTPIVSIIIPNYNHVLYLRERLDSVFKQTFVDYEIILLDDASTDKSQIILEEYRNHPKVSHLIINTENSGGPFEQWKKGIELAEGKYIWIAESDDVANELFLEETVKFADSKMNLGLVFVTSKVIDAEGVLQKKKFKPQSKTTGFTINSLEDISNYLVKNLSILNASSVLFKADILKSLDLWKLANFKNTGDRYIYIQVALRAKLYFLDKELNSYRSHALNVTKQNIANHNLYYDRLTIVDGLIKLFAGNNLACENLKQFYFEQTFISLKAGFYKTINKINYRMYKYGLFNFKEYIEMLLLSLFSKIFKKKFPYRIGKYYRNKFKNIQIY